MDMYLVQYRAMVINDPWDDWKEDKDTIKVEANTAEDAMKEVSQWLGEFYYRAKLLEAKVVFYKKAGDFWKWEPELSARKTS